MRRFLQKFPILLARNLRHSPASFHHSNINPRVVVPSLNQITSHLVFFSSESDSTPSSKSDEVVSKEELKKRIQTFLDDGDEDAIPDLFEAMMIRKLSGKHDDSDDEVMEEVRKYPVVNKTDKVDDTVSDIESDGLRDGDSLSDSDDESNGLRGDHLSDAYIDSDDTDFDDPKDVDLSNPGIKIDGQEAAQSSESDCESD